MLDYAINEEPTKNQAVILVADAEDTPKEMYEDLGFQYVSYQISAQKELWNDDESLYWAVCPFFLIVECVLYYVMVWTNFNYFNL